MKDSQKEQEIFNEALERKPELREEYLEHACGTDKSLRERVEILLEAYEGAGNILDPKRVDGETVGNDLPVAEQAGERIGRYKLLEKIGEGGMGVVFMAEQEEPVRRRVALKIIKLGMDTKQVVARFEAERQALALLDHPNIAKVLDADATETGRPYFVMDLVHGIPITKFCDENKLTTIERLGLFIPVCQAIQHAHQKGIIHRDLKPSNILVSLDYSKPIPKVIDFGISKATNQRLTEKTLFTHYGQMVGTPAYMSPEQAEMTNLDVDTRTDVYSLGVLLYELLTGTTPISEEALRSVGLVEMQRLIKDKDAERPSIRVSTLADFKRKTLEKNQSGLAHEIRSLLQGDLDWIVLRAIEKDRRRRYDTPNELILDIENYLNDKPVKASPPSKVYLARKFFRRHQKTVAAFSFGIAAMMVGLLFAVIGLQQASNEADRSTAVLGFFIDDLLGATDPVQASEDGLIVAMDLRMSDALNQAAQSLGDRFSGEPLIEAEIRMTLGRMFERLRNFDTSERHLRKALRLLQQNLGDKNPKTLEARDALAWLEYACGNAGIAETAHRSILKARLKVLGAHHEDVFESMNGLASAMAREPENYSDAETLFNNIIEEGSDALSENHPIVATAKERLAGILYELARFDESARLKSEAYEARKSRLGADHPDVLRSAANHLNLLSTSDAANTEAICANLFEQCRTVLGESDFHTLLVQRQLAVIKLKRGLAGDSFAELDSLLETTLREFGSTSPNLLWARDMYAQRLYLWGRFLEAERMFRSTASTREGLGVGTALEDSRSHRYLAWSLLSLGRLEEAETIYRNLFQQSLDSQGPDTVRTLAHTRRLTELLGPQARWAEIAGLYGEASLVNDKNSSTAPLGELPITSGVIAAWLNGEMNETRRLLGLMLDRYPNPTNATTRLRLAQAALTGADLLNASQTERVMDLANHLPDTTNARVWSNLARFHQGAFQEVTFNLRNLTVNPNNVVAGTAGYVRAMSLHQLGRKSEAIEVLNHANSRIDLALQSGLLGREPYKWRQYMFRWVDHGACLILRQQAETLIIGEIDSEPITTEFLSRQRIKWEPTQQRLLLFESHGQQKDWETAKSTLVDAMSRKPLNWDPEGSNVRDLPFKAACVFALSKDEERYAELVQVLAKHAEVDQWDYLRAALLSSTTIEATILTKVVEAAQIRANAHSAIGINKISRDWVSFFLGLANYRSGNLEQAAEAIARARESYDLVCAAIAHAVSTLVVKAQGGNTKAHAILLEAKKINLRLAEGNPRGLGEDWYKFAMLELFIREAEEVMVQDSAPSTDTLLSILSATKD